MMCVGFFSAANLIAAKPVIEIIIGEMTYEKYQEYLAKKQAKPVTTPKTAFAQWWRDQTQPLKDWRDRQVEGFYEWASNSANRLRALLYVSMVIFSFTLIKCFSEYWSKYLLSFTLFTVGLGIKENLFAHVMAQDAAFFQGKTTGFLESRINSDVKVLERLFEALIREAIQEPITITALLGVLFYLNWQLTLIALVVLPIAGLPLAHFSRRLRKMTRKSQRENDMLFSHAEEALRNYRIVKVYHSEEFEVRRFKKRNAKLFYYFLKQRVASFSQSPIMETMGMLGAIGVLMYGGMAVTGTKPLMTGSDFIIYLVCLTQFYTPIRKLAKINTQWQGGKVSAERIREIFSLKSTVTENENALPLERIQRGIQFDHVTFCYHETPVLDDITFEIPLGKTVAIVGRSGAGKTSLVNLIPRLYDPSEGAVLVDGRSATDCRLQDLRRCFGFVTQDTILFNDTVTRNIAYAEREAIDMRRVEEAARLAHAHEFILALEGGLGYETVIGQAGQRLSGGQRQRLAIARAIYRDPQILIFDEATSALDEESQRHVQEAIDNLLKHRTAIIIAHRLSTIRNADIIIVMDKGKIIETGNHDALMAQQGLYWSLYSQGTIE
ncbi:MAG: ABC transporter transmembrane domain-containing protein [Candidatus Sumerlaeota bacterium]|nr:ABC transporter transmembrane domain-containing protein [Candidatus Sumerlaeota bacterium]